MKIEILLSCMHQKDTGIVARSNIQTDVVVVNQCDTDSVQEETYLNKNGEERHIKFISTSERGLSRSRNMAIRNSTADICQIADDDETFENGYTEIVTKAFQDHPDADVIAFKIEHRSQQKAFAGKVTRIGYIKALSIASVQIAFKRKSILNKGIFFDEEMGSGTNHGACEENKFLYDCLRNNLNIVNIPLKIASLHRDSASAWFRGYDSDYFVRQGWATQRFMGTPVATLYAFYTALTKNRLYHNDCTAPTALSSMLKGIYSSHPFTD